MKQILHLRLVFALLLTATAPTAATAQTVFFNDTFTNGSTLTNTIPSPAPPTATNTAYQLISSKAWVGCGLTSGDLKFGIAATTAGSIEMQGLFATNAVALVLPGDYIQLTVVFTNTAGLLTAANTFLGVGLYNSGQVQPVPGGLNGTAVNSQTAYATGYAQNWKGYWGQTAYSGQPCRILTRPAQSNPDNRNQDLVTTGSGSQSYTGGQVLGTAVTSSLILTAGATYTAVLTITMNGMNSLAITNVLYAGPDTSGTVLTNYGGIATNANFLTGGFDALCVGWRETANTATTMEISSITVAGSVTPVNGPPTITVQPAPILVATNGSCSCSITTVGYNQTYQWHRNGTNLNAGGNISIVNSADGSSSQLIISPASVSDALDSANGYYVTVTGASNYSTNSVTNALTLIPATNLFFAGNNIWDVHNSAAWDTSDSGTANYVFDFGDPVVFGDNGGGTATLNGSYLSAASATVSQSFGFLTWSGSGSFAGPGNLIYNGSAQFTINNANSYSGGTIISNASANLKLGNLAGLGTGPVTLGLAGGQMEIIPAASSTTGIPNDFNVADDFNIIVDPTNTSFGVVLNGNLSGTAGKTLTISHNPNYTSGTGTNTTRIRAAGSGTVYGANLALGVSGDTNFLWACYQSGSQTYNGVISGLGSYMQKAGVTYLNGPNTYSGTTTPAAGAIGLGIDTVGSPGSISSGPVGTGPFLLFADSTSAHPSASAQVFAVGGGRTIANAITYASSTNDLQLLLGGTNNLTFTGPVTLNGDDAYYPPFYTNRTFNVTNTALTTLAGVISDSTNGVSAGVGLIKTGNGVLVLSSSVTETYTGPTTVSAGTLQANGSLNAASAVTVNSNATLSGSGSINGPVTVAAGGTLAPGTASIGTLSINNNLTLAGNVSVRVNRSGFICDEATVSGALTNVGSGTITVTNLGATLQAGDTFHVFNQAMSNSAALVVIGGNVAWANNLAVDGTIVVTASPDVGVLASVQSSVALGLNFTNTLTVTNLGPGGAYGLVVTDALPANVTYVSATGGGTTNGHIGQVVWNVSSLAANASTNLILAMKTVAGGYATNIATVISSAADPASVNNSTTNVTLVTTVIIPNVSAHIGSISLNGANVVINGTNGVNGGTYYLLDSTNAATPLGQWIAVATNIVNTNGASGAFSFTGTNVVTPNGGQQFYILSNTNNH